jgi:hypothetical protein
MLVFEVLMGKPEGKRSLGRPRRRCEEGRPRRRWEDEIRMDLGEITWGVWIGFDWLRIGTGGWLLRVR